MESIRMVSTRGSTGEPTASKSMESRLKESERYSSLPMVSGLFVPPALELGVGCELLPDGWFLLSPPNNAGLPAITKMKAKRNKNMTEFFLIPILTGSLVRAFYQWVSLQKVTSFKTEVFLP